MLSEFFGCEVRYTRFSALILSMSCVLFSTSATIAQDGILVEICDNGLDDDGDGFADLNDEDCACRIIEPESLIPNASFEEMNCCPATRSQLHCANTWIQASEPTTDYIHRCDWLGWEEFPPPEPFPDGQGIVGFRDGRVFNNENEPNWKEYAGACLTGPLLAGVEYRFEFYVGFVDFEKSPPINITFFGTEDCMNLPFGIGDDAFGCPTNDPAWIRLGSRRVSGFGGSQWVKTSIDVRPAVDIRAISIGPDCPAVRTDRSLYYFFDHLVLSDKRSFDLKIKVVNHPCSESFTLEVPGENHLSYQWYKNGLAIPGENEALLGRHTGEGIYQVRVFDQQSCEVTAPFEYRIPVDTAYVVDYFCEGRWYEFGETVLNMPGDFTHTFQNQYGCDSVVFLVLDETATVTNNVSRKIFPGETLRMEHYGFNTKGIHTALLTSSLGCDSVVEVDLDFYDVFIPNAFSPNGDGKNDLFEISKSQDIVEIEQMSIYDRWGVPVFDDSKLFARDLPGWDGTFRNNKASGGVYLYQVQIRMNDQKVRRLSGTVLLIR